jgi:E3 ubiquitin-protein ligase MARCH6
MSSDRDPSHQLAFFMLIELVIFPLGCGYLLDACLLPLFNEGTYAGRLAFQIDAPLISSFLHWIGGTL